MPEGLLGMLAAYGVDPNDPSIQAIQEQGSLAASGDHYVDSTGNALVGAPDANGMFSVPLNADGSFAGQPQGYGFGPPYNDAPTYQHGADLAPSGLDYSPTGGATGVPSNWQDFAGRDASTGGGFFTIADLYSARGQDVPSAFQAGSNAPSTNNYRLLPPEYRMPKYIMRNGHIIDTTSSRMRSPGNYLTGDSAIPPEPAWKSGAGLGFPVAWAPGNTTWGISGWPGQIDPMNYDPGGN